MLKRAASSQLNHENWDDEDEPEQPTDFKLATPEVMAKRIIKTGKRRLGGASAPTASPFAKFSFSSGANNLASNAPAAAAAAAAAAASGTGSTPTPSSGFSFPSNPINGMSDPADKKDDPSKPSDPKRTEYLSKLKGLNEEVISWMNTCMEKNPFCIFTPVFEDYNAYLKKIKDGQDSTVKESSTPTSESSSATGASTSPSAAHRPFAGFKFTPSTTATTATPSFFSSKPLTSSTANSSKPEEKPKPLGNSIFGNLPSKPSDAPALFSFGNAKPFSLGNAVTAPPSSGSTEPSGGDGDADGDDEPPKNDFKPVTEEDAIFSQRAKVFVKNADSYSDRGVGMLYVKKVNSKYQVIVRADTSLGNLILNIILNESMPIKRVGKNNVLIACVPIPEKDAKTVPTLLKVKTEEEADKLFEELEKYKTKKG